jgi:hypothetical protein
LSKDHKQVLKTHRLIDKMRGFDAESVFGLHTNSLDALFRRYRLRASVVSKLGRSPTVSVWWLLALPPSGVTVSARLLLRHCLFQIKIHAFLWGIAQTGWIERERRFRGGRVGQNAGQRPLGHAVEKTIRVSMPQVAHQRHACVSHGIEHLFRIMTGQFDDFVEPDFADAVVLMPVACAIQLMSRPCSSHFRKERSSRLRMRRGKPKRWLLDLGTIALPVSAK